MLKLMFLFEVADWLVQVGIEGVQASLHEIPVLQQIQFKFYLLGIKDTDVVDL